MRLRIAHETEYRYAAPLEAGAQLVRLFPRTHAGLDVEFWCVTPGAGQPLRPFEDGFANLAAIIAAPPAAERVRIEVTGEVVTRDTGGRWQGPEPLPPIYFLRETSRTGPDDAIRALVAAPPRSPDDLLACANLVRDRIDFVPGATDAATPAAAALARGSGVCQDHSHVLIAALRAAGAPARYVSGYLWTGRDDEPASHAWVEAFTGGEWIGVDPANRRLVGEAHVRLATGLDYGDAAPITGVRAGGGLESMMVRVGVRAEQ